MCSSDLFIPEAGNWGRGWTRVQRLTPHWPSVGKSFKRGVSGVSRRREGATCRNGTGSSDGHFEIARAHLDCFKLAFSSRVGTLEPSISLRPVLRIVAVFVVATVCSSCS